MDVADTFLGRSSAGGGSRLVGTALAAAGVLGAACSYPTALAGAVGLRVVRRVLGGTDHWGAEVRVTLLLLVSGLGFVLVLPQASSMAYEGRQLLPFVSVTIAGLLVAGARGWQAAATGAESQPRRLAFALCVAGAASVAGVALTRASPASQPSPEDAALASALATLGAGRDMVVLDLHGCNSFWNPSFDGEFPQVHPVIEYEVGRRPVLCFRSADALAADLELLVQGAATTGHFAPLVVARSREDVAEVTSLLVASGRLRESPAAPASVHGRLVLDLSADLRWPAPPPPNPNTR